MIFGIFGLHSECRPLLWCVTAGIKLDILFFSHSNFNGWGLYIYDTNRECEIITTEQFRNKYGDLKPKDVEFEETKIQGTEAGSKELVSAEDYYRLEIERLKTENDILTRKLDQILNIISINP